MGDGFLYPAFSTALSSSEVRPLSDQLRIGLGTREPWGEGRGGGEEKHGGGGWVVTERGVRSEHIGVDGCS